MYIVEVHQYWLQFMLADVANLLLHHFLFFISAPPRMNDTP